MNDQQGQITIPEYVAMTMEEAVEIVREVFPEHADADLAEYVDLIIALRNMLPEARNEVAIPTILAVYAALGVKPDSTYGKKFVKVAAVAVHDAANMVLQSMQMQMQQRQQTEQSLRQGHGGKFIQ